ncbi:MAG: nucleotide-binding protein [Desulfurococcaceae archaeon]|nr:nucleotide-binding protein [Desulfurococcaceae archaeon]
MHSEPTSSGKIAVVLDTGALLAKYYRLLPRMGIDVFTASLAVSEVKDADNRQALLEAIDLGVISVIDPDKHYLENALLAARNTGSINKLSTTDIHIIALALMLKERYNNVVVITDDYDIQNTLYGLNVSFKPLRTRGIIRFMQYTVYCPLCYYTPSNPGEELCPFCGIPLTRKKSSQTTTSQGAL